MSTSQNIFYNHSIADIIELYQSGGLKAVDVANNCIDRITDVENKYKTLVCHDKNLLTLQSKEAQKRINSNNPTRSLEGIPIGIKDIYNTTDFPTQMGSLLWKDFTSGNDARLISYIKKHGGIVGGKTVTAEFAVHALNETLNPHDILRTPGTSSSGSAASVSLGIFPASIGTQTAGSIIRPASFCGIYGYKPSFGLVPRTGMLKTTDTLDTIGFFSFYQKDLRRIFDATRVHGSNFPISNSILTDNLRQNKPKSRPWKVAFVKTHTWEYAEESTRECLMQFIDNITRSGNIDVTEANLPSAMEESHDIHGSIYNKSLSYYFKEEFKSHELVSNIMNNLITQGNKITPDDYRKSLDKQSELCLLMDNFLLDYDIAISISTAGIAPLRSEVEKRDPSLMWTLTHIPSVNVPAFKSKEGLPFGIQIFSRKYNDYLLMNFLDDLEKLDLIPKHGIIPNLTRQQS